MSADAPPSSGPAWARRLGAIVPLVFLAVSLVTLPDYGETWDEQFDQNIGRFYAHDWSKEGLKGLERFIPLQRNYGPFFDVVIVETHDLVVGRLHAMKDGVASYHLPVVLASTAALWIVFRFGTELFGAGPALVAQLSLALMPQFVGHSQNNLKDTPLMAFFMLALLLGRRAVRIGGAWRWALLGAVAGLTYAIKLHAFFIPVILVLWELGSREGRARWKKTLAGLLVAGAAAFVAILAVWPYYRHAPIARFLETLRTFGDHEYNEYVFYLGRHYRAHDVPWHFPFVMLGVNTPLVTVFLFLAGLALAAVAWRRKSPDGDGLRLVTLWFFVPILVQVLSHAIKLDGVRHYLLVLPAMALVAGWAAWEIGRRLGTSWGGRPRLALAWALLVGIALLDVLRTDVHLHPYEVVFFNALAGGPAGAREKFELDYWGVSFKQAAEWMNANLPNGSRLLLTVQAQHFLHIDPAKFQFVPDLKRRPNYKINLIRGILKSNDPDGGDYLHPAKKPVYAVTVDGANLLEIFEYEQNRDLPDGSALEPARPVPARLEPGLEAREYGDADFGKAGPEFTWTRLAFDCEKNPYAGRAVSLRGKGLLVVERPGTYTFEIHSDDDAVLWLNGKAAVANPSTVTTRRRLRLGAGAYDLIFEYRNDVGAACLSVAWGPGDADAAVSVLAAPSLAHEAPPPLR
ncbi:MAG TPA: glycosyltransferase family 39 protein [Thermoanaerobaculia bacterium]|nr:glycosyltransferase family 39 protein [Thermoanaerobaculia bacterium]